MYRGREGADRRETAPKLLAHTNVHSVKGLATRGNRSHGGSSEECAQEVCRGDKRQ